jgi:hypothetical protein
VIGTCASWNYVHRATLPTTMLVVWTRGRKASLKRLIKRICSFISWFYCILESSPGIGRSHNHNSHSISLCVFMLSQFLVCRNFPFTIFIHLLHKLIDPPKLIRPPWVVQKLAKVIYVVLCRILCKSGAVLGEATQILCQWYMTKNSTTAW